MTSDGIDAADWDRLHELAVTIVNLSAEGNESASERVRLELISWLDQLDEKYGPKPSLLATRADYVSSLVAKEDYLQRAYAAAQQRSDGPNMVWIASSLASHYLEEADDPRSGAVWLFTVRQLLGANPDSLEEAEMNRLQQLLPNRQ